MCVCVCVCVSHFPSPAQFLVAQNSEFLAAHRQWVRTLLHAYRLHANKGPLRFLVLPDLIPRCAALLCARACARVCVCVCVRVRVRVCARVCKLALRWLPIHT